MFRGLDCDGTMLRTGSMNRTLHGVGSPRVAARGSFGY